MKKGGKKRAVTGVEFREKAYSYQLFNEFLKNEISRAIRFKYPICLAVFDIDRFQKYINVYGSTRGDVVLKVITRIIKKNSRAYDLVGKRDEGGFFLLLHYAQSRDCNFLAERIRREISRYSFEKKQEKIKITVSVGLSTCPDDALNKSELIKKATQALSLAKQEGGNRVHSYISAAVGAIRFGYCPPVLTPGIGDFYNFVLMGIREVMENTGNIELVIGVPPEDGMYKEQLKIIDETIEKKVDAIAICAKTAVGAQVNKANKLGIPVFVFNIIRMLKMTPPGKVTSYIGYDQKEAGRKVGRYLARLLRGEGEVAILEGSPGEIDSMERKEGFLEIINNYPAIKIVDSRHADWLRDRAKIATENILQVHPRIDAFFGLSDEMALGAQDAIEATGKKDKIFVIGLDGNQNALQSIKNEHLTATLNGNPVEMGRILMRSVLKSILKEEKVEPKIYSPIMVVDLENVDQYLR